MLFEVSKPEPCYDFENAALLVAFGCLPLPFFGNIIENTPSLGVRSMTDRMLLSTIEARCDAP